GLVCDTGITPGRVVRRMLEELGVATHVEVFGFSDEVGVPKPDPGIFAKVLADLGVKAEEAVHVGDLRRTDVAGASALGLGAVRFRGAHDDASESPEDRK